MYKNSFLFIFLILVIISITGWSIAIKYYRENKILRTTFDNSKHYKKPTFIKIPTRNKTLILFGDSRIKQWNPILKLDGINILNHGISEETTAQMILRFKKDILDINPNIVIIQAGINDLVAASIANNNLKNIIYNNSINNLKKIIDQAIKQKIIVIFLQIAEPFELGLVRSILWGNDLTDLVQKANKEILILSNNHNFHVLDTNKVLHTKDKWKYDVNKNALHFTPKAYQLLNVEIIRLIDKINLLNFK